jgi:hypothetical protein
MPKRLSENSVFFQKGEVFLPEYTELGWMTAQEGERVWSKTDHVGYLKEMTLRQSRGKEHNFFLRTSDKYGPNKEMTIFTRSITVLADPKTLDLVLITKNALGEIFP